MENDQDPPDAPTPKRTRKPLTYDQLIDQGLRRSVNGRKADARRSFLAASEVDPNQTGAWFGIAHVTRDETERRRALYRVLEIDPENERAREQVFQFEAHDRRMEELRAAQAQALVASQARQAQYARDLQARAALQAQRQNTQSVAPFMLLGLLVVLILLAISVGNSGASTSTPTYNIAPVYATQPPVRYNASPSYSGGSTCMDGTHSSSTGRGTCSHHGGVR
jgi:hypothetical protein